MFEIGVLENKLDDCYPFARSNFDREAIGDCFSKSYCDRPMFRVPMLFVSGIT